jgi:hypothetical protein
VADTVAIVEVVAGDMESYDIAIYKAKVIQSFKGALTGQTIYFGPFLGHRLGWQYVVFLKKVADSMSPKNNAPAAFGTVHYSRVFNEGYSSTEINYSCEFRERKDDLGCDYGVRVCTDYITLPKTIEVFPIPADDEVHVPFGCRQARKSEFMPMLENMGTK